MDQQELYERIEAYLEGDLTADQIRMFERLMKEDVELTQEVELHRTLHKEMQPSGVNTFRMMLEEETESLQSTTKIRSIGRRRLLSIAASVAVVAVAAVWLFSGRATTSQALYNQFYQSPSLALDPTTVRGVENDATLREITDLFDRIDALSQQSQFQQALQEINNQGGTIPVDLKNEFLFRQAILYLNLKQPETAISYLDQLTGQETLRWYKSLALLQLNRLDEIPTLLEPLTQFDNPRQEDASQLLRKLNRVK